MTGARPLLSINVTDRGTLNPPATKGSETLAPSKFPTPYVTSYDDSGTFQEVRQIGPRVFQWVEVLDLHEVTGEAHGDKYAGEVAIVDLDAIPAEGLKSALRSCGYLMFPSVDGAAPGPAIVAEHCGDIVAEGDSVDRVLAEVCYSYGHKAPIWSDGGNARREIHRAARREAREVLDGDAMSAAMDRPVNAIGSTAAEFMAGDIASGIASGVESGDRAAGVVAVMYGVPAAEVEAARVAAEEHGPADWLPYWVGFTDGRAGRPAESGDVAAPYRDGHKRGAEVRAGRAEVPAWLLRRGTPARLPQESEAHTVTA